MAAASKVTSIENGTASGALDQISFYLGRAYYNYVGLLECVLADTGLNKHLRPGMGHVLFALFEKDDRIIKEIAERVQLSNSTLTEMLKRMERAGLVKRSRCPDDGRAVRVRLTARARALKPRCRQVTCILDEVLTADLNKGDIKTVKKSLSTMIASMQGYVKDRSSAPRAIE